MMAFTNRGFRDEAGRFITKAEADILAAEKAKRVWEAPLSKDSWFGTGVGESSTYYNKVTVVGSWHGVTLSFNRSDGTDHLGIYLEPEDAKAIGEQLVEKSAVADGIQVMSRIKERR